MSEIATLFPEKNLPLPSLGLTATIKPFTFGQTGAALRVMAPYAVGLNLNTAGGVSLEGVDLNVLFYALTEGDCAGIYELCTLSTGLPLEQVQALSAEEGFELVSQVWEAAIKPMFGLFQKKFGAQAKVTGASQTSFANSSAQASRSKKSIQ